MKNSEKVSVKRKYGSTDSSFDEFMKKLIDDEYPLEDTLSRRK